MSHPVLIFSVDRLRGGITKKILERSGLAVLLHTTRILQAGKSIPQHTPNVVILDTGGYFVEEIRHLRNLCRTLVHPALIVLGDRSITDALEGPSIRKELCLPDPFDPESIAIKVKQILSVKEEEHRSEADILEHELKQFLKLDG